MKVIGISGISRVTENHIKTTCGEVVKDLPDKENYRCEQFAKLNDIKNCPTCLNIWSGEIEQEFEHN
ncbi:hypothetical protein JMM81_07105 [Bacillus sp. V3B]|uniref:hypothetical protein n=1 Tax=Bacillus sp. V3B TaxID=2804915 RepID=UPI00210E5B9B|nr:hypothetical protein [Bacillus sp. V3B]MCQ6274737.1 hypothetical protein [Bacillus sp. V3B]